MHSMSTQNTASTCIYCSSNGPFSAEHMIPAGLGADDKRFLLRDMVCKTCNTTVFSPLELEWLRSSPTTIGRIFMQAEGRKRGSKKNPPKLGARTKVVVTPEGYTAEAEIGYRGKATILPQLILVDDRQCSVSGSDKEEFSGFISQGSRTARIIDSLRLQDRRDGYTQVPDRNFRVDGRGLCRTWANRGRRVTGCLPFTLSHRAGWAREICLQQQALPTPWRANGSAC